jgi:PAS domain S-box/uncharacterized domain HDIG
MPEGEMPPGRSEPESEQLPTESGSLKDPAAKLPKTERAIQQAKEYAEFLFRFTPSAIFTTDLNRVVTSWNRKAEELTGYSAAEIIGKPCLLFAESPCQDHCGVFSDTVTKPILNKECTIKRKDGQIILVSKNADLLKDENNTLLGAIESFEDVTGRKNSEHEIRKSMEMNEGILQAIPHAVVGLENRRIIFANDAVKNVFGWSPEEVLGKKTTMFYPSADTYQEIGQKFYPKLAEFDRYTEEVLCCRRDGTTFLALVSAACIGGKLDDQKRIIAMYEDITLRKQTEQELQHSYQNLELQVQERTIELSKINEALLVEIMQRKKVQNAFKEGNEKLQRVLNATIRALASAVEKRDPYTAGHQQRVAQLVTAIAHEMKLSEEQVTGVQTAAMIHDIGKIYVPAEILSKPSKLSSFEFMMITVHPQVGYDILKDIEFPWPVADIVLQHHERMDGSGYPHGLKGDAILLESRILIVADVVEAMASHRPYRPALGIDKALDEILHKKGVLYDPVVVDSCINVFMRQGFQLEEVR